MVFDFRDDFRKTFKLENPDSKGVSKVPLAYLLLSLLVLHFTLYSHPLTLVFVKQSIGGQGGGRKMEVND